MHSHKIDLPVFTVIKRFERSVRRSFVFLVHHSSNIQTKENKRKYISKYKYLNKNMGKGTRATAGHMPLTHYERTKKFVTNNNVNDSADYGTQHQRLAGYTQYQIGTCALTTQSLFSTSNDTDTATTTTIALCSPSGYIYDESSILEYLLKQTQDIKQRQIEHNNNSTIQQQQQMIQHKNQMKKRQMEEFKNSQSIVTKNKRNQCSSSNNEQSHHNAINDLHRVSYWLSTAQPIQPPQQQQQSSSSPTTPKSNHPPNESILALTSSTTTTTTLTTNIDTSNSNKNSNNTNILSEITTTSDEPTRTIIPKPIIDRPVSPMTRQTLSRRDLWPIRLEWTNTVSTNNDNKTTIPKVKCAISDRVISNGASVIAYWTVKKPYATTNSNNNIGVIVLQSVFDHE
jgi:hypothetical protein